VARLDSFLRLVAEQQASDLHFHAGSVPVIRHDGALQDLPFRVLGELETRRFLAEILTPEQARALERDQQVDFIYVLPGTARFRTSVFSHSHGLGAVFRVVPDRRPTLTELGLPPVVEQLTALTSGLVVVTGPTGSGKTTTLAAMVHEINRTSERHVITIEDPIEFVHEPMLGLVTQREVGRHVESFSAGLRSALREAPDVLVVGEMRDQQAMQLAISAAETGLLVLATLHTNSAAGAVDRLLDVAPEESRDQIRGVLSVILQAVIAQHLLKRAGGSGRVVAPEILVMNHAVANLIREGKTHQLEAYLQSGTRDGSQSLDGCLLRHVREGLVTPEEALTVADHPERLWRLIEALPEDA
jgi:twitching motility protein PilT